MKKTIKLLEKDLKKFSSYIGNFNRILRKNGMADIRYAMEYAQFEVRIHNLHYDPISKGYSAGSLPRPTSIMCDGYNIDIEIPEGILKVGDYQYIGCMTEVDGIWQKHLVSEDCEHNSYVCKENFRCDHCHANINSRTGYLFFVNSEGKNVVVGRKCARAYFGYNVEEIVKCISNFDIFNYISDFNEYDEESVGFFKGRCGIGIRWMIPVVAYLTHDFTKWEKKGDVFGEEFGTSHDMKKYISAISNPSNDYDPKALQAYYDKYSNEDVLNKVREYWQNNTKNSDFAYNCKQIVGKDYVSYRWLGYATWAIFEALQVKAPTDNIVIGEFVGELNQRMALKLKITNVIEDYTESFEHGYSRWDNSDDEKRFLKIKFDDENGNHFQTNCHSNKMMTFFEQNNGKTVSVKGTIVRQFERKNGQKVNFITRVVEA